MADGTALPPDPLAGLIAAPLPLPISLWPQTWGSRLVIALTVMLLAVGLWRLLSRYRANAYRRAATRELAAIEQAATGAASGVDTNAIALLVRRTALVAFPRQKIASLTGSRWLSFLDASFGGEGFATGPGVVIGTAPYDPRRVTSADAAPLIALVRRWIWAHHD